MTMFGRRRQQRAIAEAEADAYIVQASEYVQAHISRLCLAVGRSFARNLGGAAPIELVRALNDDDLDDAIRIARLHANEKPEAIELAESPDVNDRLLASIQLGTWVQVCDMLRSIRSP